VVMGDFVERCWQRYLCHADSPMIRLIVSPHPSATARRCLLDFEREIATAITNAQHAASELES
jgi:phosphoenolpyruvate carboxylase